jgi:hypothetical protein
MIRVASLVSFNQPLVGRQAHSQGAAGKRPLAERAPGWLVPITSGVSMQAMILSVPPQRSHCSISIPNTRFKR